MIDGLRVISSLCFSACVVALASNAQPISRVALDRASCGQHRVSCSARQITRLSFCHWLVFLLLGYAGLSSALSAVGPSPRSGAFCAVILVYVWLKKYTFLPEAIFIHAPYFTLGLSYIFFRVLASVD